MTGKYTGVTAHFIPAWGPYKMKTILTITTQNITSLHLFITGT